MTFKKFSQYLDRIDQTASRNEITGLLVNLLREVDNKEAKKAVYLALGGIASLYKAVNFNLADKMIVRAISRAFGKTAAEVQKSYKKTGDLGITVAQISPNPPNTLNALSISFVFRSLTEIAAQSGEKSQERKLNQTADLLKKLDPLGAKFVVRIILGKLRLGFSDKTVLDALSFMTAGDKSARKEIEAVYNVRPDVGWLAREIKSAQISQIPQMPQLGVPVIPALCQRLPTTEEIIKKMSKTAVEPKWDGQRIQAHIKQNIRYKIKNRKYKAENTEIHLFTRSLEDVTPMFPDLIDSLRNLISPNSPASHKSLILDGEVVGIDPKTGMVLSFQTMITRKRKYDVLEKLSEVPIRYMVFDILELDGKSLIQKPFFERRKILRDLFPKSPTFPKSPNLVQLAPQIVTDDPNEIRKFLKEQIDKGLEGVVAKKYDSPYSPGRTGFHWVKLKWEGEAKLGGLLDTVDGVVMGIYRGKGKRSGFGVGAFLVGIFCPPESPNSPTSFLTISKIGTGLTDNQWRQLRITSNELRVMSKPVKYDVPKSLIPDAWMRPELVAEIQADNITRSPLHTAGYALRFPRLVRYRNDKKAEQATTKEEIEKLYEMQS